ncbi:cytochrome C oxidase subunit IV family protein [Laceyella putida]|uniref:Cytochrome C oxidase subunit IV family protein n=1 Tax=Laceyella putida TaxID=110101 RepID=A0ABW2RGK1_9BACL
MEPKLQHHPEQPTKRTEKPETAWRHILSFVWMILFTAIAFYVVGEQMLDPTSTFWVLIILAAIQVALQLFTFMHLNQKGYGIVILFFALGLLIAVVSAVGVVLM